LDSSIKKNAAFIKKLRQLGEDNKRQILDDIKKLNLTKVSDGSLNSQLVAGPSLFLKQLGVPICAEVHFICSLQLGNCPLNWLRKSSGDYLFLKCVN
jgi:hypothetical protein